MRKRIAYGLLALLASGFAQAQETRPVKIGVLTDLSGLYADIGGPGAVEAVKMAVEDFGGKVLNRKIEVISADTLNKPDVATSIARRWYDTEGVDMIIDLPSSPIAIAVQLLSKDKNKVSIVVGAGSDVLTGKECSPTGAHWVYDSYSTGKATVDAVMKRGGKSWYLLQLDQAFGDATSKVVVSELERRGGKLLGRVRHPLNTPDFASFVLQAQASGAQVIALANAGGDTINAIKQAQQFGVISGGQQIVALLMFISDVRSVGLNDLKGLILAEAFYWDLNDQARQFAQRFMQRTGKMPTSNHAGDYSATMHYLKAIAAAGTDEARAVMSKMRETPIADPFTSNGKLRVDGRMVHDIYLMQVKKPEESKGPWDVYNLLETIPGDQAFRPLAESECSLVQR